MLSYKTRKWISTALFAASLLFYLGILMTPYMKVFDTLSLVSMVGGIVFLPTDKASQKLKPKAAVMILAGIALLFILASITLVTV